MFIYNIKINGKKLAKIVLVCMTIIILCLLFLIGKSIFKGESFSLSRENREVEVQEIAPQNYTNVLKEVHDDLDTYIGQKIRFSGFVYRLYDFERENFVLARNMIVSSDFQVVVVGFYCHCSEAVTLTDNTWIELEGTITKGDYHGEIPLIEVTKMQTIEKPNEEYVYPPSDDFIATSSIVYQ